MKPSSCIVLRPLCFLIFLMVVVLSLAGLLIPLWIDRVARIENQLRKIERNSNQELISRVQKTASWFSPANASAINLARVLSSSLDENDLHFAEIETKVASTLFQALSAVPYLSQISYVRLDGLFFAYYTDEDRQLYALYSNSTFFSTNYELEKYTWYLQPANRDNGKLYGEAAKVPPPSDLVNSSWFLGALNNTTGYVSVGTGLDDSQDILLLSTAGVNGRGAMSLGYSMKWLIDSLISEVAFNNGILWLATMDGNVLVQGIPNTRMILERNQISFQLMGRDGVVGNMTCQSHGRMLRDSVLSISGRKYVINCSPVEIAGLQLVYMLALPHNEFSSLIHKNIRLAFALIIGMIGFMLTTICTFVYLIVEAARREMYLCGALIKQMEATLQSERKSMNKTLAFASASHDIRAPLAGINGLIEICRNEVSKRDSSRSEIVTNLIQMECCTKDLLGILNSILDTSKIEAGKMQLEEQEFDIEQLLEDAVDLFHSAGIKKGVDVILDPYDGSIMKNPRVKGDCGKLKQILSNLLSNAVKFTSDGHVTVRAWARKPTFENEILASRRNNSMSCPWCLLFKIDQTAYSESEVVNTIQRDPNCMEFLFEVNDTGKGIPKEKQKSVFENYVQVKETEFGQEGTGLGLGIVQSLVRLMGGEIGIMDKEFGQRGTCFRFNVFLSTCEPVISSNVNADDLEANGDYISSDSFQYSGSLTRIHSHKTEASQVILFIKSTKRSNLLQNFMVRLGIKVHVVEHHKQLSIALKKIKGTINLSRQSSSNKSEGRLSSTQSKEVPLSSLDGTDNVFRHSRKKSNMWSGFSGFILIMIDTRAGPFQEVSRAVAEFRKDLNESCCTRVVWLNKPEAGSTNFQGLDENKLPPSDLVISKPFHGSRLYQAIGLLPEFGGMPPRRGDNSHNIIDKVQPKNVSSFGTGTSKSSVKGKTCADSSVDRKGEIEEVGGPNSKKPLVGKKILVVDDDPIGRKIASFVASQLGANIVSCENGEEAWKLVCTSLDNGTNAGASKDSVPFDCILMDCEMPVMDGTEGTARIREAEKSYGVHIPIIALTAHKGGEEVNKMIEAGVDGYLTKPLNRDNFWKAVSEIREKT